MKLWLSRKHHGDGLPNAQNGHQRSLHGKRTKAVSPVPPKDQVKEFVDVCGVTGWIFGLSQHSGPRQKDAFKCNFARLTEQPGVKYMKMERLFRLGASEYPLLTVMRQTPSVTFNPPSAGRGRTYRSFAEGGSFRYRRPSIQG